MAAAREGISGLSTRPSDGGAGVRGGLQATRVRLCGHSPRSPRREKQPGWRGKHQGLAAIPGAIAAPSPAGTWWLAGAKEGKGLSRQTDRQTDFLWGSPVYFQPPLHRWLCSWHGSRCSLKVALQAMGPAQGLWSLHQGRCCALHPEHTLICPN